MIIKDLFTNGYGKFHEHSIHFDSGINLLYGKNEAGKSTLHSFMNSMFFGSHKVKSKNAKGEFYHKYKPWDDMEDYKGLMRFEQKGITYRIERDFKDGNSGLFLTNETMNQRMEEPEEELKLLLNGLTGSLFRNTISIGQLRNRTDHSLAGELKNYMANLHTTGNLSLNIENALEVLKRDKKIQEAKLHPDAKREMEDVIQSIRELKQNLGSLPPHKQNSVLRNERQSLKAEIEEVKERRRLLAEQTNELKEDLEKREIGSKSDILSKKTQLEESYKSYFYLLKRRDSKTLTASIFSLFFFTVIFVGAATWFYYKQNFIPSGIISGICIVTYAAGNIMATRKRHLKRQVAELEESLGTNFEYYTGKTDINPDQLEVFFSLMEDYRNLYAQYEQCLALDKALLEETILKQKKIQSLNEDLEILQRTEWESERIQEELLRLYEQKNVLENNLRENERVEEELNAINLALETVRELSVSIHDSFGIYLNSTASRYLYELTGHTYDSMSMDENLHIYIETDGRRIPLEQTSAATMAQLYLSLRLSIIELLWPDGDMPLLLDNSFALYDDERLASALEYLASTYKGQILLFTCHKREGEILKKLGIPYQPVAI